MFVVCIIVATVLEFEFNCILSCVIDFLLYCGKIMFDRVLKAIIK